MPGKKRGRFFWLQLSVNISSVCLRSLCKINILHIEHIIILVRPGHCMIACEHVFKRHAWPTGRDHPYKEPLQAGGCVLVLLMTLWASQPRLHRRPLTLPCVAHLANPKNNKYAHPSLTNQNKAWKIVGGGVGGTRHFGTRFTVSGQSDGKGKNTSQDRAGGHVNLSLQMFVERLGRRGNRS